MPLCFIEPQDAIRVIAESVGREARRQLLGELVRAWVDEIPEEELESHYAKAVADLDEHDLSMLAAWHASLEVGHPIANRDFLVNVFSSLGENRREALKIAAGFRGEEAFDAGVAEEQALDTVLPFLSRERSCDSHGSTVSSACSSATPALNASSPRMPAAIFSASRRASPSAGNALTRNSRLATGVPHSIEACHAASIERSCSSRSISALA
jgi:hypothetical protein